jgi:hypothetical protein
MVKHFFTILLVLLSLTPTAGAIAQPTSTVWGQSGVVLMPNAHILSGKEYRLGINSILNFPDYTGIHFVPSVSMGLLDSFEVGGTYGVPAVDTYNSAAAYFKYQLLKPTKDKPTALAVGANLIGFDSTNRYQDPNNLFMVISHDFNYLDKSVLYNLFSAHLGFSSSLSRSFASRLQMGLDLPFGPNNTTQLELFAPDGQNGFQFNAAFNYRFFDRFDLKAYSLSLANKDWWNRDYGLSFMFTGELPQKLPQPNIALGTPVVAQPTTQPIQPTPQPISTPDSVLPNTTVQTNSTIYGSVLDDLGRPLSGWKIQLENGESTTSNTQGQYLLTSGLGAHTLTLLSPDGKTNQQKSIRLVQKSGLDLAWLVEASYPTAPIVTPPVAIVISTPAPVVVTPPPTILTNPILPSTQNTTLLARLFDEKKKTAIATAQVRLSQGQEARSTNSKVDGSFRFFSLNDQNYTLQITHPNYKKKELTAKISDIPQAIALDPLVGKISGLLSDKDGKGIGGISIGLDKQVFVSSDDLGRFFIDDIPPGLHVLVFRHDGKVVAQKTLKIEADNQHFVQERIAINNNKGGIIGMVVDGRSNKPLTGVKLYLEGEGLTITTLSGFDGRFNLENLPPGRYKITATKQKYSQREIISLTKKEGVTTLALTLMPL